MNQKLYSMIYDVFIVYFVYIYSFILNNNKIHPIQSRHIHHPVFGCYTVCPAHRLWKLHPMLPRSISETYSGVLFQVDPM